MHGAFAVLIIPNDNGLAAAGRIQDAEQHMAGLRQRQQKLRSRLKKLSGKIQTTTERIGIIRGGVEEAKQEAAAAASSEVPAAAMDGDTRTRQELIDDLEAMYQNSSWNASETQADSITAISAAGPDDEEHDDDADEGAPPQPTSAVGQTMQQAAEEEEQVEIVEEGEAAPQQQLDAELTIPVRLSSESSPAERPSAFAREPYSNTGAHADTAGFAPDESKPEAAAPTTTAASTAAQSADADADEKPKEVPVVEERALLEDESQSKAKRDVGHRFGAELPGVVLAACVLAAAQALMSLVSESKKHRAPP